MSTDLPESHPYWYVRNLVQQHAAEICRLSYSFYEYVPQSLEDRRQTHSLETVEFLDRKRISEILNSTPPGEEFALHSEVEMQSGELRHIPMVDMSTSSTAHLAKVEPFLGQDIFSSMKWYKSGRSFHGYGGVLITTQPWVELMGRLLLVNKPGLPPTVDPRWVGHRLIAGYAALRWTRNTAQYLQIPTEAR